MKHIPASHMELVDATCAVALSTVMLDGQLQITPAYGVKDREMTIRKVEKRSKEKIGDSPL